MNGFIGNLENLIIIIVLFFEVFVNWLESYILEEMENIYIVEYKCDLKIMKILIWKWVLGYFVYLIDLYFDF